MRTLAHTGKLRLSGDCKIVHTSYPEYGQNGGSEMNKLILLAIGTFFLWGCVESVSPFEGDLRQRTLFDRCESIGSVGSPAFLRNADFYPARNREVAPLVVVLPIYDSVSELPQEWAARILTEAGYHVLVIQSPKLLFHWEGVLVFNTEQELLSQFSVGAFLARQYLADVSYWVDETLKRREVLPGKVGMAAFSLATMFAVNYAANDPRVGPLALIMAGSRPHEALAYGFAAESMQLQRRAHEMLGWNREKLSFAFQPILAPLDPLSCAHRLQPVNVFYVEAIYEDYLGRESAKDLWEALGRPEKAEIGAEHKMAFASLILGVAGDRVKDLLVEFFERRLP